MQALLSRPLVRTALADRQTYQEQNIEAQIKKCTRTSFWPTMEVTSLGTLNAIRINLTPSSRTPKNVECFALPTLYPDLTDIVGGGRGGSVDTSEFLRKWSLPLALDG